MAPKYFALIGAGGYIAPRHMKAIIDTGNRQRRHHVDLTYVTSRGNWYFHSWKGDLQKSGGVATNIGIHFFDMLMWIFGPPTACEVHLADERRMGGFLELGNADVRWFLSVDRHDFPASAMAAGNTTFRSITVDGEEVEFSEGFVQLHTEVYLEILTGHGFGIEDARPSNELVHGLRQASSVVVSIDRGHALNLAYRQKGRRG